MKKKSIHWICLKDKCPNNCCGYFKSSNKSIIDGIQNNEIPLLKGEEKKVLSKQKVIGNKLYLKINKDSSCPFWDKGSCKIYANRPSYCKAYPFYIDPACGLCIDKRCPGLNKGWTELKDLKETFKSLKSLYNFWIDDLIKKIG